jgi:8-oxo-dGTP pyrophosphatase MutT (NUDIX family)
VVDAEWARPFRLSAYIGHYDVPDDLVVSVRCLVRVGDEVVLCTDSAGAGDVLPGGRRREGETYVETACREVHEETGWRLDLASLEPIGLIHLRNLGDPLPPYPYPDAVHLVCRGLGVEREAADWTDTEGQIVRAELVSIDEADRQISGDGLGRPFLRLAW